MPASIRVVHRSEVPRLRRPRFAFVPIEYAIGLIATVAIPVASIGLFVRHVTWVAPVGWVLLPMMALVMLVVCAAIGLAAFEHVRASLGPHNWLAQVTDHGLLLNARSFLNWRYPPMTPTVAIVPYAAIASVHAVHETFVVPFRQHRTVRYASFTVLTLVSGVEVADLDDFARAELGRVPAGVGYLASLRAWDDVPVFLGRPGEIWVTYRTGRLHRALRRVLPVAASVNTRVSGDVIVASGDRGAIRRLALDTLYRGRRVDAARVLQMGFGLTPGDADDMLSDVVRAGA